MLFLMVSESVLSQPPPPPPDPDGTGTAPYPPGWVGKSPVGDGAMILIAFAMAYALRKYLQSRKRITEEEDTVTE